MVEIVLVDVGVGGPGTLGVHRAGVVGILRWDLLMLLLVLLVLLKMMIMVKAESRRNTQSWLAIAQIR